MKNILIPTDFSENSRNALEYALGYFKNVQANFYLIHVDSQNCDEKRSQLCQDNLNTEIQFYQNNSLSKSQKFFAVYERMSLIEGIRKHLTAKKIDYIVMGTKGDSTLISSEIGSNTSEVITKIKCPIFVIPRNARFLNIDTIAFPTDYNCSFRKNVRHTLADTLSLHKAAVHVLNVKYSARELSTDQLDNKSFLKDMLKEHQYDFHVLESRTIENGIQTFTELHKTDLITMVAKNLNLIQRLLFNPKNADLNYRIELPFLVIHE